MQLHSQIQGKVKLDHYTYNPEKLNENFKISTTVWYMGNQSIQEVPHLDIKTDSTGNHMSIDMKYYLFIDPDLHQYFYYGNFSDTARLLMHYKGASPIKEYGGWDFYSNKEFNYDNSKKLTDTVIDESNYGRYRFRKINNDKINDFILYTECKKKDIPIKYLKPFSEKIGYPIIKMDVFYEGRLVGSNQLQYISDTLTNEEKKVFQIWRNSLKGYR